jgi:hypothetical protein
VKVEDEGSRCTGLVYLAAFEEHVPNVQLRGQVQDISLKGKTKLNPYLQ